MARHYKINGYKYPSVTTIISDCTDKSGALTQWAANMVVEWIKLNVDQHEIGTYPVTDEHLNEARFNFRKVSQDALDIGSEVHHCIEHYLKTGKEPKIEHDQVLAGFVAFLEWKDENNFMPFELEETVCGNCWAGTLDFRGLFDDEMYIIDFKTSKAIYLDEMGPQIAAYRSAFPEAKGCGILRLDKVTGLPEWKDTSKRYEKDLNIFNKMLELYMARHPRIAKGAGWKGE